MALTRDYDARREHLSDQLLGQEDEAEREQKVQLDQRGHVWKLDQGESVHTDDKEASAYVVHSRQGVQLVVQELEFVRGAQGHRRAANLQERQLLE